MTFQKKTYLIVGILLLAVTLNAHANPQGESVVAGTVAFDRSTPNTLTVNTASNNTIINYNSFSIAANETTRFNQPCASSTVLNRVVGVDPSSIYGTLSSNGRLFLVNPNGILFGAGSKVDAPAIVASTLDIANEDFLKGNYKFFKNGQNTFIVNKGRLASQPGGYIALLSQAVDNQGLIIADLGTVALASGEKITLALDNYAQISVVVDDAVKTEVLGSDGQKIDSAIKNSGTIQANGGKVILTAKVFNKVFDYAVNNTGVIQAKSLIEHNGVVELVAEGAPVYNIGKIEAGEVGISVKDAGFINKGEIISNGFLGLPNAGRINITAATILQQGKITANAFENGRAGEVSIISASSTVLDEGSSTEARALGLVGNGGRIMINSTGGNTVVNKNAVIDVSAGTIAGNAGFIEVSAYRQLGFFGILSGRAPPGYKSATVLFDPIELTGNITLSGDYTLTSLDSLLVNANITITAGNITLSAGTDFTLASSKTIQTITSGNISISGTTVKLLGTIKSAGNLTITGKPVNNSGTNSIQTAINAIGAVTGTTTINVAAGTYTEQLTINKVGLTLQGDGYPLITYSGSPVIKLAANNITIKGFEIASTIQDTGSWTSKSLIWDGTWSATVSGLTVDDCKLHDSDYGIRGSGLYGNVVIKNSEFYRLKGGGVLLSSDNFASATGMTVDIHDNYFHDFWYDTSFPKNCKDAAAVGINNTNAWIKGNVYNNYISGMKIGLRVYYAGPSNGQIVFSRNTIDMTYQPINSPVPYGTMGFAFWGVGANASNIIIRDNIIANCGWYGIYQEGATMVGSVTVDHNLFYNNYKYYWPNNQYPYQWSGTDTKAQVGWTGGEGGFTFINNITTQDPKFALSGSGPENYWALQNDSSALSTASDGANIGAWQHILKVWIDDNADPSWYNLTRLSTIQNGVNLVEAGGTVGVASGAYDEDITITKILTLTGTGSPTANKFILNSGADVSSSSGITAPTVDVNGAKIQDGILLVASNGTVNVAAGTYNENLTINKSLTLTVVAGSSPVLNGTGIGGNGILINAPDVTIDGFDIKNYAIGIRTYGGPTNFSNLSILNNNIHDNSQNGILVVSDIFNNVTIDNCVINNNSQNGIGIANGAQISNLLTISNSQVTNSGNHGLFIANANIGKIDIKNSDFTGSKTSGYSGITFGTTASTIGDFSMQGGSLSDNKGCGLSIVQVPTTFNSITLNGVTIKNNSESGIMLGGGASTGKLSILNSTFSGSANGNGWEDVDLSGGWFGKFAITGNTEIKNNIFAGGPWAAVYIGDQASFGATPVIYSNSFSGYGNAIFNANATVVNASGNWFGTNNPTDVATIAGAKVDYTPWLDSGTDTDLAIVGFQGNFSKLWVDDDSQQTGTTGRIQEGIDLVTTAGTVNVSAGTYNEDVTIAKDVILIGTGNPTVDKFILTISPIDITGFIINNVDISGTGKIQNGVDLVKTGGTVGITAGTYDEDVTIAKALTLTGTDNPTTNKFILNSGADVSSSSGITAPTVDVNGAKVQDGILLVAPSGTVNVAAGTYKENVTVNKALTLIGADAATTILDGSPIGGTGIEIDSNDVTVKKLNIQNYNTGIQLTEGFENITIGQDSFKANTLYHVQTPKAFSGTTLYNIYADKTNTFDEVGISTDTPTHIMEAPSASRVIWAHIKDAVKNNPAGGDLNLLYTKGPLSLSSLFGSGPINTEGGDFILVNKGDLTVDTPIITNGGKVETSVNTDPNLIIAASINTGGGDLVLSATGYVTHTAAGIVTTSGGNFTGSAGTYYDSSLTSLNTTAGTAGSASITAGTYIKVGTVNVGGANLGLSAVGGSIIQYAPLTVPQLSNALLGRYAIPVNFSSFQVRTGDTRLALLYHPLTEMDEAAFDAAMNVGEDAYQFMGDSLNLIGHEGLLPVFDDIKEKDKHKNTPPPATA